jgi:hypothetical protein
MDAHDALETVTQLGTAERGSCWRWTSPPKPAKCCSHSATYQPSRRGPIEEDAWFGMGARDHHALGRTGDCDVEGPPLRKEVHRGTCASIVRDDPLLDTN